MPTIPPLRVPRWRKIDIGTGPKTVLQFRAATTLAGAQISETAERIIARRAFVTSPKRKSLFLVKLSVEELGFTGAGAVTQDIYKRAFGEYELKPCPPETGPELRIQYPEQPLNETLIMGMEAITNSVGQRKLFKVERDGEGFWLRTVDGQNKFFWGPNTQFVFVDT